MGFALHDLGALHAEETARSTECESLVRRALVIHNLDGRFGQVGHALKTRGILERTRGRWDQAEAAFAAAASSFDALREPGGLGRRDRRAGRSSRFAWGTTSEPSLSSGALARRLEASPASGGTLQGRLAFLEARAQWRLGALEEVRTACDEAAQLLPPDRARERVSIGQLRGLVDSLLRTDSPRARKTK